MFSNFAAAFCSVAFTLLCTAAAANEPPAAPQADAGKGQTVAANVCAACHTFDGSRGSPANPIIAGQGAAYLAKQLREFKSGARANPVMSGMAAPLTDADILNVSAFYAGKDAKEGFAKDKDTLQLGEKIFRAGIAAKQVPACAGCHSANGAGLPTKYPRLAGQHADYTAAQMNAFRAGTRKNSAEMIGIAARLSDAEIKAVADYIAGLH